MKSRAASGPEEAYTYTAIELRDPEIRWPAYHCAGNELSGNSSQRHMAYDSPASTELGVTED